MFKLRYVVLFILFGSLQITGNAQLSFLKKTINGKLGIPKVSTPKAVVSTSNTDTLSPKSVITKKVESKVQSKVQVAQKLTQQQEDSAFLKHPLKDAVLKLKNDFHKKWNNTFVDFTDNTVSLMGGMISSKQNVTVGAYNSNFNYDLADYNKNAFKPGYYAGFRVDGKFKEKHEYTFAMSLNKIASGARYKDAGSLNPFLGSFSTFKADDQFFTLSIAAHYRKMFVFGDTAKRKYYLIAGPSIDTRLSGQSADNLVNNNYQRFILRADIGLEFDNQSFYTFFIHYKQGLNSFTKSPIKTTLNSMEIGMMIKASDLF